MHNASLRHHLLNTLTSEMLKCEKHVLESMKYNISRREMNLFYIDFT